MKRYKIYYYFYLLFVVATVTTLFLNAPPFIPLTTFSLLFVFLFLFIFSDEGEIDETNPHPKKGDRFKVSKIAFIPFKMGDMLIWLKYYQKIYEFDGKKWNYIGKEFSSLL